MVQARLLVANPLGLAIRLVLELAPRSWMWALALALALALVATFLRLFEWLHSPHSSDASAALPLLLQTMRRSTHAGGLALPVGELVLVVRDCLIIIRSRGKAALASLECGECS